MSYKLLIVEDETIIRRGLVYSMDWHALDCGEILEAADGREAVEIIKTEKPDIVIADINIPFLDGLEVLEATRDHFDYSAIILTGYPEFEYAQRAVKVGAVRFLLKPVDFDELAEAIEDAKESRRRRLAYSEYRKEEDGLRGIDLLSSVDRTQIKSGVICQILEYVDRHYAEKLTLHDLAGELHYSESFLIRRFKEEMKLGFSEYLTRYRIQKAIILLRETNKRTEIIAEECGFLNAKYLNTVFRKHVGCSLREYVRLLR